MSKRKKRLTDGGDKPICQACPQGPSARRPDVWVGSRLDIIEHNYSGTGSDIGNCPNCGKAFFVSYAVSQVDRAEDWDRDFEQEKAEREQSRLRQIAEAEERLAKLKANTKG